MDHPSLQILMRYLHICSAVLAVGGLAFAAFCLRPALRLVDDAFAQSIQRLAFQRFHRVLVAAIAGLTLSGAYNWYMLHSAYKALGPAGNILIGVKVLLALAMFGIALARMAGWLRQSPLWLTVNLHLGALVILLGALLRFLRAQPPGP